MDLSPEALKAFFLEMGEKPFRASQVLKWIYHHYTTDFSQMTDLGKALREKLASHVIIQAPEVIFEKTSDDGTRKWLMSMNGGNAIETVFIPDGKRGTLCVSSQVGCGLNCTFCSTSRQGFNRNLSTSEIIGQVWNAAKSLGHEPGRRVITNIVLMGMGEPLLNFDNVLNAVSLMRDDLAFGMAGRRVTLSTAGLVPQIDKLREHTDIALAVSLHATRDDIRNELVPLNKKYPIKELLAACKRYIADSKREKVTIEYTLIEGRNDRDEHARELVTLLSTIPSKVNLIPFNPFPGVDFKRPSENRIRAFQKILLDAGMVATVRRTRGDDIDAACGQLVGQVIDRTKRSEKMAPAKEVAL